MIAVEGYIWAIFALVLVASAVLIVRTALGVLRRLKELRSATRAFAEELNEATENINSQLERAQDGVGRIRERRPAGRDGARIPNTPRRHTGG